MQNGEHSSGGAADTAPGTAPGRASADAAADAAAGRTFADAPAGRTSAGAGDGHSAAGTGSGTTAAGWLDRIALHSRPDASSTHALRPRLPYPFEAMKFATADAGPRVLSPDAMRTQPQEAAATTPHASRADDLAGTPATDPIRPAITAPAAIAPFIPAAAAPPARQQHEAHPYSPARQAGSVEPAPAKEERAPLNRDAHAPSAISPVAFHPVAPSESARPAASQLARLAPTAARRLPAAPTHNETSAASMPARQKDHAAAHATPRHPPPASGGRPPPQPIVSSTASMRPAGPERSQPALRGAPPAQSPLTARPSVESAPEITIDIHIGRIDVRAPASAPAPAAVQAPPQRGSDALNSYLARRARGARS